MTHLFTVDYTRVILSSVPGIIGSDYVNANFIKGASGSLAYIASQGPLPHTASDFWRMVIECEVQVIVMACNEEESGKVQINTFAESAEFILNVPISSTNVRTTGLTEKGMKNNLVWPPSD
jgi:protein tyrosine phosphatase